MDVRPAPAARRLHNGALLLLALLAPLSGCSCGAAGLRSQGVTTVAILAPAQGAQFKLTDTVSFSATAANSSGLATLALSAGAVPLKTCAASAAADAGPSATTLDCQTTFSPGIAAGAISATGALTLTATASTAEGDTALATLDVLVSTPAQPSPWSISFVLPALTQQSPPVADVHGQSAVQIAVSGTVTLNGIEVTDESRHAVAGFAGPPYSKSVTWGQLGAGQHTLTATATDDQLNQQSATRVILVACSLDSDCGAGTRCCPDDGQCHPMVASGADCDCAHPCPLAEGCYPGTCGAPPQKCRPGCFPGHDNPDRLPDNCAAQGGVAAWCAPLPPGQVTTQNKGGACAPGDGCNVHKQDCPDKLLDPSRPAGPTNPVVSYTCEPASATATACFPAGTHPAQDNNPANNCKDGADSCGNATVACVKGYLCTSEIDHPERGNGCFAQCTDPVDPNNYNTPPQSRDCASGQYCDMLYGTGGQVLPTGVCQPRN